MEKYKNFILTLGYGRSGSTMVGSIINNHPNCIISNESQVLYDLCNK